MNKLSVNWYVRLAFSDRSAACSPTAGYSLNTLVDNEIIINCQHIIVFIAMRWKIINTYISLSACITLPCVLLSCAFFG